MVMVLIGVLAFVGLPLLSWGISDVGGFLLDPARLLYCVAVPILQIAAALLLPGAGMDRGTGDKTVERQRIAARLMLALSLAIMVVGPYCDRRGIASLPGNDLCRYAGLALFALGFGVMIWATACLGKQFSIQVTLQKDHQLVTDGPYRFVRHPRYFGILVFLAGSSLLFRSRLALILVVAMAMVLTWRIHDEEKLMRTAFQAEWEVYAQRTRRLIPFVF